MFYYFWVNFVIKTILDSVKVISTYTSQIISLIAWAVVTIL